MNRILLVPGSAPGFARRPSGTSTNTMRRLGAVLKAWWSAYRRRRGERATIAHLRAMSDRELKDIGIVRSQIEFAVENGTERGRLVNRVL